MPGLYHPAWVMGIQQSLSFLYYGRGIKAAETLGAAFVWANSDHGGAYWADVANDMRYGDQCPKEKTVKKSMVAFGGYPLELYIGPGDPNPWVLEMYTEKK